VEYILQRKKPLVIIFTFSLRYFKNMRKLVSVVFFICHGPLFCQTGGGTTFALLDLGYSARSNALGTDFITVKDQDVNLGVSNPSLYNSRMNKMAGFNQAFMAGGINYGMATYARRLDSISTLAGHLRYIDYGKMNRTDEAGNNLGTFSPSEYILGAGMGRQWNPQISVGANVNLIYSQLESYNSFGASVDLAGTFTSEKSNLLVTALVKNAGIQFKGYTQKNRAALPADFQLGVAHKLAHAPFRFSLLAHHLNKWDLTYVDPALQPTIDALTGDTIPVKFAGFGEKLAHHFTYQVELLISKSIQLRAAFDYHRRQELKLVQLPGVAGFSFGVGLQFKRITVDYGFSIFSKAGYSNSLSISSNLGTWKK
jgi:hypothetical protein